MARFLTFTRRTALALWLFLIGTVITLVVLSHVVGPLGYRLVIIRGPSMSPTIPLGAVAFEQPIAASAIQVCDVVTMSLPNGPVITHRVVRVATIDGQPYIETRGDANNTADPTLQPASIVTGVVRSHLPLVGFVLAFLSVPSGIVCVVSMLGSLLATIWLLEEIEADMRLSPSPASGLQGHGLAA
jgi:signal peptidase I